MDYEILTEYPFMPENKAGNKEYPSDIPLCAEKARNHKEKTDSGVAYLYGNDLNVYSCIFRRYAVVCNGCQGSLKEKGISCIFWTVR